MIASGSPRFDSAELAAIQAASGDLAAWREAFKRYGIHAPEHVAGSFSVALRVDDRLTFLAVDRFAVHALCYRIDGDRLEFAKRADELAPPGSQLDHQAIFDYVYFHVIPAPRTVFKGVSRLPAGHYALHEDGRLIVAPWWKPVFQEESKAPFSDLKREFLMLVDQGVARCIGEGNVGCFLSGGTDSSTVTGMLGRVTGKRPVAFSIGFEAEGYDEMEYARIAARHFGAEHHEYYVTPEDLVRSIPEVAGWYDQPFGNSSVVPSYYCARVAKEAGIDTILAGDGGDELFGGNARYAKQRLFGYYERIPGAIRSELIEPAFLRSPLGRLPLLRKVSSYIEQARVPMPDRLQMYNLLMRLGCDKVFTPDFLEAVDVEAPARREREVFALTQGASLINRMLAFDWQFTLADNDLPKVLGATGLAQLAVAFPFLDDDLTDFSLRLAPELKLKGQQLRWFFKEALREFLPDPILAKKKHGFGLPFGVWSTKHAGLKSLAVDSLESLKDRGIVRRDFLDRLIKEYLPQHPGYYGEMVWILMMLEQWLNRREAQSSAE